MMNTGASSAQHEAQRLNQQQRAAYTLARTRAAWYLRPTMGKLLMQGADAVDLLHRMTTNNMLPLHTEGNGCGVQTVFVNDKARMLEVVTALRRKVEGEHGKKLDDVLLLCSGDSAQQMAQWLDKYTFTEDVRTDDVSLLYTALMVFGPQSAQFLADWMGEAVSVFTELRPHHWKYLHTKYADIMLVKMPPLCELCYVLLVPAEVESQMREELQRYEDDVPQIDDETFETLRIESGLGKHGVEWTDKHNPLEAGLVGAVSFTKGCYIGQEVIARLDTYNKVKVRLMGFVAENPIPVGAQFVDSESSTGSVIGSITSSTFSPELGKFIALGYIRTAYANPGMSINAYKPLLSSIHPLSEREDISGIKIDSFVPVVLTKLPFVI
jgi:folate-binding protein YgfZ